jgi:hypothetical protein
MLHWVEIGGPEVQEPARRGYGSALLEQGIIFTLGGTVDLRFPPKGVRCRIELPLNAKYGGPGLTSGSTATLSTQLPDQRRVDGRLSEAWHAQRR